MKNCQVLVLKNQQILVSQLEPTDADLPGEPDVKLIDPCVLNTEGEEKGTLTKWLEGLTPVIYNVFRTLKPTFS